LWIYRVADSESDWAGQVFRARYSPGVDYRGHKLLLTCVLGTEGGDVRCDPAWRTAEVLRLAEAVYAERAFDRLPVLADLLEEAGATDAQLLAHLRGQGPHALGCHALDAVLGKE
jgi:hypothetical protein